MGGFTGCFSSVGVGSGGTGKIGGAGGIYEAGCSGTRGSLVGAGNREESSERGGGNLFEDGGTAVPEVRDATSGLLNHPVNPVPAGSFPARPGAGEGSSVKGELNIAVKSPTVFRGESIGGADTAGVSDGPSARKGP